MKRKYLGVHPVIELVNMNTILFYRWVSVALPACFYVPTRPAILNSH